MKKNLPILVASIVCILLIFNSIKIISLQEELDRLRSDMNDEIHNVSRNIDGIYGEVENILEEETNQLAIGEWKYGNINIDARTVEIICTVVPKVYMPDITQATLVCNGCEYDLIYANDQYTTTIELPLFDRSELTMIKLNENGTLRMQELNWIIEPRYEALLLSYAGTAGSATGKMGNGEYIWSPEYTVIIDIENKGESQIQSVELVEMLDGKEWNRIPIDLSNEGQNAYAEDLLKIGEPIPEVASRVNTNSGTTFEDNVDFIYCLDKDYHIPNGSMLELYVDVVDGNGLRYRSFAYCMAVTADGEPDELRMEEKQKYAFAEAVMIFDETDTIVYEVNPELFQ